MWNSGAFVAVDEFGIMSALVTAVATIRTNVVCEVWAESEPILPAEDPIRRHGRQVEVLTMGQLTNEPHGDQCA